MSCHSFIVSGRKFHYSSQTERSPGPSESFYILQREGSCGGFTRHRAECGGEAATQVVGEKDERGHFKVEARKEKHKNLSRKFAVVLKNSFTLERMRETHLIITGKKEYFYLLANY